MNEELEVEKKKEDEKIDEQIVMIIPECCREGWDSCPHVVNRNLLKKKKQNIAL